MITVIVGAQYGGEGKGKIAAFLGTNVRYDVVCRCGGVNSSHTVVKNGESYKFRMLPTTVSTGTDAKIVFGAGSLIHIDTLLCEMNEWNISSDQVLIDKNAGIVSEECVQMQRKDPRYEQIGSTLTGTGYATAERSLRRLKLAKDYHILESMIDDASEYLYRTLSDNGNVLVEGHQGAMLSNYHGDYPYTSSRDSVASAMLSELGIGLAWPVFVVLVFRAFEVRNHKGRLNNEIRKSHARKLGVIEFGGGSWGIPDRERRVGFFDPSVLQHAVRINTPSMLAITGADHLSPKMYAATDCNVESQSIREFLKTVESLSSVQVGIVSTGPETKHAYFRTKSGLTELCRDRFSQPIDRAEGIQRLG